MKLILEILGSNPSTHEFKSLRAIQKHFPQYEYHQLRAVYLQTMGRETRKQHQHNKQLYETIRIRDKPILLPAVVV